MTAIEPYASKVVILTTSGETIAAAEAERAQGWIVARQAHVLLSTGRAFDAAEVAIPVRNVNLVATGPSAAALPAAKGRLAP